MQRLLLLPFIVLLGASDGDSITPDRTSSNFAISQRYLCADKTSADTGACATISDSPELPHHWHFLVANDTGCSAYDVDIQHRQTISSDWFNVCSLTNTGSADCYISLELDGPLMDNIRGNINTATGCTDLDVIAEFYQERR